MSLSLCAFRSLRTVLLAVSEMWEANVRLAKVTALRLLQPTLCFARFGAPLGRECAFKGA